MLGHTIQLFTFGPPVGHIQKCRVTSLFTAYPFLLINIIDIHFLVSFVIKELLLSYCRVVCKLRVSVCIMLECIAMMVICIGILCTSLQSSVEF